VTLDLQSLSLWAGIAASVATTASVVIGWLLIIGRRIKADFDRLEAEVERVEKDGKLQTEAANERAKMVEEELRRSIEAHKLFAAEHFATEDGVNKALEPVLKAIERLADRLDRILAEGVPSRAPTQRR
jgi:hypothetical protein